MSMGTEFITEIEFETKVNSILDKSNTDKIIVSTAQRSGKWFLSITHQQESEEGVKKYSYKIRIRDKDLEKGYKNLDKLTKRLREIGLTAYAIGLI